MRTAGRSHCVCRIIPLLLLTACLCGGRTEADVLDDARTLVAQGKYDEVDAVLRPELKAKTPKPEALRISLEAAVKAGRVVAANQRVTALLNVGEGDDPELLCQGAELARQIGDVRLATARYLKYVGTQNEKSDKLQTALQFLLRQGAYPGQYRKFVRLYGTGGAAWSFGEKLLRALLNDADAENALATAEFLLESFADEPRIVYRVHDLLRDAGENYLLGRSVEDRYVRVLKITKDTRPSSFGQVSAILDRSRSVVPDDEELEIVFGIQEKNPGRVLPWYHIFHLFQNMRGIPEEDARIAAGKRFLAFEKTYRDSTDPEDYTNFVRILVDSPQVFHIAGKELVSDADIQAKFGAVRAGYERVGRDPTDTLSHYVYAVDHNYLQDVPDVRNAFLKKNIAVLYRDRLSDLIGYTEGKEIDAQIAEWSKSRNYRDILDMRVTLMPRLGQYERKDALLSAASDYMHAFPGTFNWSHVFHYFTRAAVVTDAEKLSLLNQILQKGGTSGSLRSLVSEMAKHDPWKENEQFKTLQGEVDDGAKGDDTPMRTHVALQVVSGEEVGQAHRLVERLFKTVDAPIAGGWELCASPRDVLLVDTLGRHANLCWNDGADMKHLGKLWGNRLGLGSSYARIVRRLREHGHGALLFSLLPHFFEELKKPGRDADSNLWYDLSQAQNPSGDRTPVFRDHYAAMGWDNAVRYVISQREWWDRDRAFVMAELDRISQIPGFKIQSSDFARHAIHHLIHGANSTTKLPPRLSQALWDAFWQEEADKTRGWDLTTASYVYGHYIRSEHWPEAEAHLRNYLQLIAKRPAVDQVNALNSLYAHVQFPVEPNGELKPAHQFHTILNVLKPQFERLSRSDWQTVSIEHNVSERVFHVAYSTDWPDGEAKTSARALDDLFYRMLLDGTYHGGYHGGLFRICHDRANRAIADSNWEEATDVLTLFAVSMGREGNWDSNYSSRIAPLVKALEEAGRHELAFAFLETLTRTWEPDDKVAKQIALLKGRAAQQMPDVILVDEKDPTYPLVQAAFCLSVGDEAKAWSLTSRKLDLLPKVWEGLDQTYVSWCVEQMRKQRMFDPALKFAFLVLLRETDLDPETAAAISLTKGDCYRDMENYQAARVEYQALMDNKRYRETLAGATAEYRLIDLLILTRDYTSAEGMLERLLTSDDRRTQAEALYRYARIMFDQGQYRDAKDYLRQVKDRVINHVEAAFLEGELNLKLPGGLQYTEVPVGNPRLSTIAIPGRDLTLKLQDSNLAVARAKSAIPVIVRTSQGQDLEHVKLLPSATNKNLFTGTIATALGTAQHDNLRLELRGDDVVTYVIDPEFQKANDLEYPPKELEVRADGRLVASSGEILTEEEEEQRELQRRLLEQQQQFANERQRYYFRDSRTVRPGNDIYVQVRDFDRDLSDEPDKVTVDLRTSSGDVLEAFELTETDPHSGLFRGAVPTGIPFPKAIVSDEREDQDPGVMINTGKAGAWTSLSDGRKPKWVEVDTMTSSEVKTAYLDVPDPARLKRIELLGMLSDEYQTLAQYPERNDGQGRGLNVEFFHDTELKEAAATRVEPMPVFDLRHGYPRPPVNNDERFSARWTGTIVPRYSETYTFEVHCDDGVRLWIGETQLIDRWRTHHHDTQSATVDLEAGKPVALKMEYFDHNGDGCVYLAWSSVSQNKEWIPQSVLFPPGDVKPYAGDGVRVTMAYKQNGHTPSAMIKYLSVAPTATWVQDSVAFDRRRTPWARQEWYTVQITGTFYVPENRGFEFRFGQSPTPNNWQYGYLFIDGEQILGGRLDEGSVHRERRIQLTQGAHRLRVLARDYWGESTIRVHYRTDDGTFADLPPEWFSVDHVPALAEHVRPAGTIALEGTRITAVLDKPQRLRRLRWLIEDFTGNEITVNEFGAGDATGDAILPVEQDFTSATANRILEISPGDRVYVSYKDDKRLREHSPILTAELNSSYFNGTITLANEEFWLDAQRNRRVEYQPAKRCRIGDQLTVLVHEYDLDVTDNRDTVDVLVKTSSGEELVVKALETMPDRTEEEWHAHAGRFLAVLKLDDQTSPGTIGVKSGDIITASYLDKENTKPGIPIDRTYSVQEGGQSKPEFLVYRTQVNLIEDTSVESRAKLERLRREFRDAIILRENIVATHPRYRVSADPAPAVDASGAVTVDANAPLLLELTYPKMVLHLGSTVTLKAVSETELKAAEREGRDAQHLEVPLRVYGVEELARIKGYHIQLQSHQRRRRTEMLEDGIFAGVIRLQVGSPGDAVDDLITAAEKEFVSREQRSLDEEGFRYRVPTLLVSGSDTVHLEIHDVDTGETVKQDIRLVANGRLELLDGSYTVQKKSIYLGERFYLRVTDPDRDTSDERDTVDLTVSSASGDKARITLSETLAHSGVFTGSFEPQFAGESAETATGQPAAAESAPAEASQPAPAGAATEPAAIDDILEVGFGDDITFLYRDALSLDSADPLDVTDTGRVHYGADAGLAAFSKKFKDPEMAVKTRFLTAEALFEMAKQERTLEQKEKADEHIAEGKRILEEAMRDYPDTSLVVQGEFLLANLAQELEKHQEAISRYSHVIRTWPDTTYAARSQYKKAICLEKMGNYDQACEEYVRLTYIYPESELVPQAVVRLASHYYKEKNYGVAAKIFFKFQQRDPEHELACKALFLSAQCEMKLEEWKESAGKLNVLLNTYDEPKELRAEAMYWLADCEFKGSDYVKAYQTFKKITWDYPESKWAKIARGRLTEEAMIRVAEDDM